MVASPQRELNDERMKICTMLWDAGIRVSRRDRRGSVCCYMCYDIERGFLPFFFLFHRPSFLTRRIPSFLPRFSTVRTRIFPSWWLLVGRRRREEESKLGMLADELR